MKTAHVWEIPDQLQMRGGDLYDRWANLTYFANTAALVDKTASAVDKAVTVKAHTASRFMRDPAPYQVSPAGYTRSYFGTPGKGALPGYTVTFVSDAGLPGQETRRFQYTGTLSALVYWLKETTKMQVYVYWPNGKLTANVPATTH